MIDETEINEKIEFYRDRAKFWGSYPSIASEMTRYLDVELKKLADLKSKPMTAIMFGAVEDCAEIARERGNNTAKERVSMHKMSLLWAKENEPQIYIDWESRLEQKRIIANYVTPESMLSSRIEQERMINNDLIPVSMEKKVVKVPEFNSKCCICSMPCNKKGKISICDGGCK